MHNRCVIFDMDGVLFDSGPFHLKSWEMLAGENGINMTESFFWETFGRTNDVIIPMLFERELSPEEITKYSDRKEVLYREIARGNIKPPAGLKPLIKELHNSGWKLAVGSSGPKLNIELVLKELGIIHLIKAVTSAEDVTHGKPHPEVFLKSAQKVDVPPERSIVVEDSLHGIESAKNAGMKCIAITTTEKRENLRKADLIIDSFQETSLKDFEKLL